MLFHIDESDARPIYQQIVDEVRRGLVVGTLKAEDMLPSVRQLAAELRVNPNTVQQAYRELERAGLAYVRRGQGTYVAEARAGLTEQERGVLALSIAQRALRDAYGYGLDAEEVIEAIRAVSGDGAQTMTRAEGGRA